MLCLVLVAISAIEADAKRGADLFVQQRCTACHSIEGNSSAAAVAGKAPDLARRLNRDYSPAGLASRIWNHAPQMWAAMRKADVEQPKMNEGEVADLFAFFYSVRYFDQPGDAARGKHVFEDKKCGLCHSDKGPAIAIARWSSLRDPVELVERMWNHAPQMVGVTAARKMPFPTLDSRELTDLLVYLQNTPELRNTPYKFSLPTSSESGKALLASKGCTECHKGAKALDHRIGNRTLTDIAASMWNHAPTMRTKAALLTSNEMREILGYLWSTSFFDARGGSPGRGRKMFSSNCGGCHEQGTSGAPKLEPGKQSFSSRTMVSALWRHGPKMLAAIEAQHKEWPRTTPTSMADLIAYLNGKP